MGMSESIYKQYLDYIQSKLEHTKSKVFIIDSASSISSNNLINQQEAQFIFNQYQNQGTSKIKISERNFQFISSAQGSEDGPIDSFYVWTNPEDADDKRICIITQLADGVIYGVESPEIYRLDVLE